MHHPPHVSASTSGMPPGEGRRTSLGSTARPVRGTPEVTRPMPMASSPTTMPMPSYHSYGNTRNVDPLRQSQKLYSDKELRRGSLSSASDHGSASSKNVARGSLLQPLPYGSDHGSSKPFYHPPNSLNSLLQPFPYGLDHGGSVSRPHPPPPNAVLQPYGSHRSPHAPMRSSVISARHPTPLPQRGTAHPPPGGANPVPSVDHARVSYNHHPSVRRDARSVSVPRSQAYAPVHATAPMALSPNRTQRRTVDAYVPWSTYDHRRQPRLTDPPVSELSSSTHNQRSQRSVSAYRGVPRVEEGSYQYSPPQRRLIVSHAIPMVVQTGPSRHHKGPRSPPPVSGGSRRGHPQPLGSQLDNRSSTGMMDPMHRSPPGPIQSGLSTPMRTPPPQQPQVGGSMSRRGSNHSTASSRAMISPIPPPMLRSHPLEPEQGNTTPKVAAEVSSPTPIPATQQSVVYFNTNGSAKHIQYNQEKLINQERTRPQPIEGSAGSRIFVFLGPTSQAFVAIFNEDDGNKKWQSKIWYNVPDGLDQKLRTLDTVLYCSFAGNNWFIVTRSEETGNTNRYWSVDSEVLNSALSTYAQSNVLVRLVFGENGQYVVLHGTNGYQLGPNVPTQLQIALDRAYSSGSIIHSIHGLNSNGRFLLKESTQQNSGGDAGVISFRAQGLPPNLDQKIRTRKKTENSEFVVPSASTSWIVLRDDLFERDDDVHYELVVELDGFYSRHKNRQEKRLQEISEFSEEALLAKQSDSAMLGKEIVKSIEMVTVNNEKKSHSQATIRKKVKTKTLEPTNNVKTLRDKEDRIIAMGQKTLALGDRVSVLGVSKKLGDMVLKAIDPNKGTVTLDKSAQTLKEKKTGSDSQNNINRVSISRIIKYNEKDGIEEYCEFFQDMFAVDKYEAAVHQYHIHCLDGICECKEQFWGFTERFQLPSLWKVGDRVNVIGYTDGIVIQNKPKYSGRQHMVHVQYDDGTSYHVRTDQIRPLKRCFSPNSCSFTSLNSFDERGLRLRPLFDDEHIPFATEKIFNEYLCAEKIDLRRLQKLVAYVQADSDQRKACMKSLVASLNKEPNNLAVDQYYRLLEYCYDMEESIYMLYDFLKGLKMDEKGCVAHEILYSHKNASCRGRLFAIGRSVRVLYGKYPRSVTIQGLHAELRAPLTGAFAHEVDCENSDVRLLCSLAQQLGIGEMFPSLHDYKDNRENWITTIHNEYPAVPVTEVKRLVNVIVCGGSLQTWLKMVGQVDVVSKVKRFSFRIQSEVRALCDQLIYHPRFQWISFEWKQLEENGRKPEEIKAILLTRILHACENEVIGLVHRSFHNQGWIVRAKLFDSVLVEKGPNVEENASLNQAMHLAEVSCLDQAWDIRLVEKPLYECQDKPLPSFAEARAFVRAYHSKTTATSSGATEGSKCQDHSDDDDDDVSFHDDSSCVTSSVDCQQEEIISGDNISPMAPGTVESMRNADNHSNTKGKVVV